MCTESWNKERGFKWATSNRNNFEGLKYSSSIFQVFFWKFSSFILANYFSLEVWHYFSFAFSPSHSYFFLRPDQGKCYPFSLPDAHPSLSYPLLWSVTNLFNHCLTTELLFLLNFKLKVNWCTDLDFGESLAFLEINFGSSGRLFLLFLLGFSQDVISYETAP